MAENKTENQDGWMRQIGAFPMIAGVLGGGSLLAGVIVLIFAIQDPTIREKIDAVREIAVVPALFVAGGLLLLGVFFLLKEVRLLERKMATLNEHSFDREVAALLAALRPFAERLEERIGPVLTASQKLQKPLDAVHLDLQQQVGKIQDLTNGFDELKMLVNRTRDDVAVANRGKNLEPLQKQLDEISNTLKNQAPPKLDLQPIQALEKKVQDLALALRERPEANVDLSPLGAKIEKLAEDLRALQNKKIEFPKIDIPKVEIPSFEPLQRTMEESLGAIRDRQESLAQMLAQLPAPGTAPSTGEPAISNAAIESLQTELAASKALVERCLSAAQTAAEAAQRAASAAEQASNRADRVEQTLRSMPAAPAITTAAPASSEAAQSAPAAPSPEAAAIAQMKPPAEPAAAAPQEKRSIKDAIAKLKMLRGGPG